MDPNYYKKLKTPEETQADCSKGGKAPRRPYRYSLEDIAKIKGLSIHSVRRDKKLCKFQPDSLESVLNYCLQRRITLTVNAEPQ